MSAIRLSAVGALLGLTLSACAATAPSATSPASAAAPAAATPAAPASLGQRDLSPEEKKVIIAAVAPNLKDPNSARYHWVKFPVLNSDDSVNYCATVDAKSPYPPYNGRQAYIIDTTVMGGKVTGANMDLIAGGKDAALVAKECAKYGLDPFKST